MSSDLHTIARLFREARTYWPHLVSIVLLDLVATPLALLTPLPLMIAVDNVIGDKPYPEFLQFFLPSPATASRSSGLVLVVVLVIVIALLTQLRNLGSWLIKTYTGERLALELRAKLLRHAQFLSLKYHDSRGVSDSVYRIQYDAPAIQWTVVHGFTPFVTGGTTLVGMVYVTAMISWQLALIALTVSPLLFGLTRFYARRLRREWTAAKNLETSAFGIVQEVLAATRIVRAFGQEAREEERYRSLSGECVDAHLKAVLWESSLGFGVGLTIALGTALVLFLGVQQVMAGTLSLGALLLVMAYLAQIYQPISGIGKQFAGLQGSLASADRAFALLDEPHEVADRVDARPLRRACGKVEFKDVSFAYDGVRTVLKQISFDVSPGTRVGVMGRTGAGKSTLVNLLTRFYDPTAGVILLDGLDLRDYRLADLRKQFGIVLQEPVLFSNSIAENIAYGRPGATREEIIAAAKAANAHEFIEALPERYEARVGDRGMKLSGGQRQRIALARAFLRDAPILILDEPTSAVDVRTEGAIMDAISRLMEGRTAFMIAHRLTTLADCDVLFEVENGNLSMLGPEKKKQITGNSIAGRGPALESIG